MKTIPFPQFAQHFRIPPGPRWTPAHDVQALLWAASTFICNFAEGSVLEIGCNEGQTTQELAKHFDWRQILAVDTANPSKMAPEQQNECPSIERIGVRVKNLPNITIIPLTADRPYLAPVINQFTKGYPPIRVAFVDGDHSYAGVRRDTDTLLEYAKNNGPMRIIYHDVADGLPDWVGVRNHLLDDVDRDGREVTFIDGTWIAYVDVEVNP